MFEEILKKVSSALASKNIPYMVIGGQAVLIYGEPRLTRDIDITLGIGISSLPEILSMVKKLKLSPIPSDPFAFVKKTMVLPCLDQKSKIRVDFIFSFTPYEKQAIERANKMRLGSSNINFASVEDVIIHKIFAGRPRDIEDVKAILLKNPKVDILYIRKWLKEFEKITPEKNLLKTLRSCFK